MVQVGSTGTPTCSLFLEAKDTQKGAIHVCAWLRTEEAEIAGSYRQRHGGEDALGELACTGLRACGWRADCGGEVSGHISQPSQRTRESLRELAASRGASDGAVFLCLLLPGLMTGVRVMLEDCMNFTKDRYPVTHFRPVLQSTFPQASAARADSLLHVA